MGLIWQRTLLKFMMWMSMGERYCKKTGLTQDTEIFYQAETVFDRHESLMQLALLAQLLAMHVGIEPSSHETEDVIINWKHALARLTRFPSHKNRIQTKARGLVEKMALCFDADRTGLRRFSPGNGALALACDPASLGFPT